MNLHEFQAKQLFAEYGVPIPRGFAVTSPRAAVAAARELGGDVWVVKAQVHAGGRGQAGGVKLARSATEVEQLAGDMLGSTLITQQTGSRGLPVHTLLVEEGLEVADELYLSVLVDRSARRVIFMASPEGGMDIEKVAAATPEKILTVSVNPTVGLQPYQCRKIGFGMGLGKEVVNRLTRVMMSLYTLFVERDASLVEINPLVITGAGEVLALDAKINVDDNALYRRQKLAGMRDPSQEDERENQAHEMGSTTWLWTVPSAAWSTVRGLPWRPWTLSNCTAESRRIFWMWVAALRRRGFPRPSSLFCRVRASQRSW